MEETPQDQNNMEPEQPIMATSGNRRKLLIIASTGLIAVVLVFAGVVMLVDQKEAKKDSVGSNSYDVIPSAVVSITAQGLIPATIKIAKGQSVEWTNQDTKSHQIASDPHPVHDGLSGFDSESVLEQGQTYSYTFDQTGTFTYHDHLNPLIIKGTVVVE